VQECRALTCICRSSLPGPVLLRSGLDGLWCAHVHGIDSRYSRVQEAAARLDVGVTTLKKICRANNISRWPFRKRNSIDKLIEKTRLYMRDGDGEARRQTALTLGTLEVERQKLQVWRHKVCISLQYISRLGLDSRVVHVSRLNCVLLTGGEEPILLFHPLAACSHSSSAPPVRRRTNRSTSRHPSSNSVNRCLSSITSSRSAATRPAWPACSISAKDVSVKRVAWRER
jgi:RWP-RK domain